MSTHSVYRPPADGDPWHVFLESDPLGEVNAAPAPPSSLSKFAQGAVTRTCARLFDLPVTIARMNASYGPDGTGGLPVLHIDDPDGRQRSDHSLGSLHVHADPHR